MNEGTMVGSLQTVEHRRVNVDDAGLNEEAKYHRRVFDVAHEQVIVLLDVRLMQALQTFASCNLCCLLMARLFSQSHGQLN